MTAYAQTFGEPDAETTSRMRKNLNRYIQDREATRTRRRHWVQASLVVGGLAIVVGGLVWTQTKADPAQEAAPVVDASDGVVTTAAVPQTMELAFGGELVLAPETKVRVLGSERGETSIELLEGQVEFVPADATHSVRVMVDRYRIDAEGARFEVRRSRGVPLVTVTAGAAAMFGPDLPDEGVKMRAAGE
jgi:ferric-dicitrate binding protein FerR (iron transport regulator)